MARDEFRYLSAFVPPSSEKEYSNVRWKFGGINRRDLIDTGGFTDMLGVSSEEDKLKTDPPFTEVTGASTYPNPVQVEVFDTFTLVLYVQGGALKGEMIADGFVPTPVVISETNEYGYQKRSVVLFNVCETEDDNILTATFHPKILIFPDKYSFDATPTLGTQITADYLGDEFPSITLATAFQGRLFGSDGSLAFASGYNDYTNWDLDTAEDTSPAHAWVSATQTNVKANDTITCVTVYGGHVILFKHGYMHEIYGTENPFRLYDVGEFGCVGPKACAQVGGMLYFASTGGIMIYNGNSVRCISRDVILDGETLPAETVLSGDFRYLYVNAPGLALRYDTVWGTWTRQSLPDGFDWLDGAASRTQTDLATFLSGSGKLYVPNDATMRVWYCETDFMAMSRVDIRRIKKITVQGTCKTDTIPEGDTAYIRLYLVKPGETFNAASSQLLAEKEFTKYGGARFVLRALVRMTAETAHKFVMVGYGNMDITAIGLKFSWGGDRYDTI